MVNPHPGLDRSGPLTIAPRDIRTFDTWNAFPTHTATGLWPRNRKENMPAKDLDTFDALPTALEPFGGQMVGLSRVPWAPVW